MGLKHLSEDGPCGTCGASVRSYAMAGRHVNGQQFESVTWECGARVDWVPNFSRSEQAVPCPKSDEGRREKADREADVALLRELGPKFRTEAMRNWLKQQLKWM